MKRNIDSERSKKWLNRNSLDNISCVSYLKNLVRSYFDFYSFEIKPYNNIDFALWLGIETKMYIIYPCLDIVGLIMLERNDKNEDTIIDIPLFGDMCWINMLDYIEEEINQF